ncbi:MAG: extracellular solute-binding protein [Clostridia bacterium]|nr:extracellular solute-binding protein [Clostridia bacterium]
MKKIIALLFAIVMVCSVCTVFSGCGAKSDNKVVIWTSGEDYRNEHYLNKCKEKFPDYDIVLEYMNTSTIAAKVLEEGDNCSADILLSEEYGYLEKCSDYLAEISDFDYSIFLDEIVPKSNKWTPECKNGGCVILNKKVLEDKGLEAPKSYEDLLKPEYKGLISMPSPASSGTGYMFLRQFTNEWGEDAAFEYFDKFSENVLQYTASGSGPMNALIAREVAIGLGMTAQAATKINEGRQDELEIVFFEEGSPYGMYGNAVLKKSAESKAVMDVFNYLATDLCKENNELYNPDQIFKDFVPDIENFPKVIKYGNMANDTLDEKERLLAKWDH